MLVNHEQSLVKVNDLLNDSTPQALLEDDPRKQLAVVEAEVMDVTTTLSRLMGKTHVLKSRINDLYCPILRQLPPEILSEIFLCCLPLPSNPEINSEADNEVETDTDSKAAKPFTALHFGTICTAWRRIAWSTPDLWMSLSLHLKTRTINVQIELLEEWLARSGDLPLSIKLSSAEDSYWAPPATPGVAIGVIQKYKSRWRDLDLRLPTSCYKYLPPADTLLPLLTSLHLKPTGGQGERSHKVDMSQSAQIKYLSLSCVYLVSMTFKWDQVTHLRLEAFYVDECLMTLGQTPQLISCSLQNIIGGDDGHTLPESPIVLEHLKTLSIDNEKGTSIGLLLDTIEVPNVTELTMAGRTLDHAQKICAMIARCTSLRTFSLLRTTINNQEAFEKLLQALKSINKFVLDIHPLNSALARLSDNVLLQLSPTSTAKLQKDCLLPALEVLEYCGPQTFNWAALLETLKSRQHATPHAPPWESLTQQNGVAVLRSIELNLVRPSGSEMEELSEETLAQLKAFSPGGLRVGLVMQIAGPEGSGEMKSTRFI